MIKDYDICVNPECTINPRVYMSIRESQKHSLIGCKIMELSDIMMQPKIIDQLSQRSLNELILEADEKIHLISEALQKFLDEVREVAHKSIKQTFLEVKNAQLFQDAMKLSNFEYLSGLQGDLSQFTDATKLQAVIQNSKKSQAQVLKRLQDQLHTVQHLNQIAQSKYAQGLQDEDGNTYRGQGKIKQGFGVLTNKNEETIYAGDWGDDLYHGWGKLKNVRQGIIIEPSYQNLNPIAWCWLSYEGNFKEGNFDGEGTLQINERESYTGEFSKGKINGAGAFKTQNGSQICGVWEMGVFVSKEE